MTLLTRPEIGFRISKIDPYGTTPVSGRFVFDESSGILYLPNGRKLTLLGYFGLTQEQMLFGDW